MDTKTKWNSKHKRNMDQLDEPAPNTRLMNLSPYLKGGTALDLACGLGGNSLFLAKLNYQVQAFDISDVAISYIHDQAVKQKLKIYPQVCDLTEIKNLPIKNNSFDIVVITYYLDRKLFSIVKRVIRENGYFFMETFYHSDQNRNQGVSDQYKLWPGEMLAEFTDWKVLFFEENEQEGRQTIFCQKC